MIGGIYIYKKEMFWIIILSLNEEDLLILDHMLETKQPIIR